MGRVAGDADLDPELPFGMVLGDYVVAGRLATGGHGSVYLGEHRMLGQRVAVKVLREELVGFSEPVGRFFREARAVSRIRAPGIVEVLDVGMLQDGRPYCVMELVGGRSLAAVIRERAPLAATEAVALLAPVCQALTAAHQAGVVHRDVKASNVMVVSEGESPVVKLLDFGVAKLDLPGEPGFTSASQRLGSASARAPEQIRSEPVDARTDVYALGVLLHHLLTGRLPFESDDADETERMHLEAEPPRASLTAGSPVALDAVVARAMAKSPAARYPTAEAFIEAASIAAGSIPRQPLERLAAVAIHVALESTSTEAGPEALAAQAVAADDAEAMLGQAGFSILLGTAGEALGIRLLSQEPAASRGSRSEAVALGRSLPASLSNPEVRVRVTVHAGEVDIRRTSAGPEIVGGPLCRTALWVVREGGEFFATQAALGGPSPDLA